MQDGQVSAVNDLVTAAAKKDGDNQEKDKGSEGGAKLTVEQQAAADAQKLADETAAAETKRLADEAAAKGSEEKPDLLKQLLADTKFESVEKLREHLAKKDEKQKSPEELKRETDVYKANLVSFAVENNLMSLEDITKYENLQGKENEDLVFQEFVTEVEDEIKALLEQEKKDENPDDKTPVTDADVLARINEEFEKEYPLSSTNAKTKERALKKLEKAAKEVRGSVESSYTAAKKRFDEELGIKQSYPGYKKAMDSTIEELVPKSFSFFADKDEDEEIKIDLEISDKDREEILKSVSKKIENPKTYSLHKDGKLEDVKGLVKKEVDLLLWEKYSEDGKKKLAEKYFEIGKKKGSDIGAKQSFETNQAKAGGGDKGASPDAQQQVLDSTRKK